MSISPDSPAFDGIDSIEALDDDVEKRLGVTRASGHGVVIEVVVASTTKLGLTV